MLSGILGFVSSALLPYGRHPLSTAGVAAHALMSTFAKQRFSHLGSFGGGTHAPLLLVCSSLLLGLASELLTSIL